MSVFTGKPYFLFVAYCCCFSCFFKFSQPVCRFSLGDVVHLHSMFFLVSNNLTLTLCCFVYSISSEVMNSFSSCLSLKVFISPSLRKVLCWLRYSGLEDFSFRTWILPLHSLLVFKVSTAKSATNQM